MSVTVGTSTTDRAVNNSYGNKTVFASTLFWLFYADGNKIVYRTSSDGITWTDATTVRLAAGGHGGNFSIVYDGTYVHYACALNTAADLFYRMGTPNSDGTITWAAAEQTVHSDADHDCYMPHIIVDSDGYPWIGYRITDTTTEVAHYGTPYIAKSSTNDGTWTDDVNIGAAPVQLKNDSQGWWVALPIALSSSQVYVIYLRNQPGGTGIQTFGKLWDGSSWGAEENPSTYSMKWSSAKACAGSDDKIYFAFQTGHMDGKRHIHFNIRDPTTGWGTEDESVVSYPTADDSHIGLSIGASDILTLIYKFSSTGCFYYKSYYNDSWDDAVNFAIDTDSTAAFQGVISSPEYLETDSSEILIALWTSGLASPYNIKFYQTRKLKPKYATASHTF